MEPDSFTQSDGPDRPRGPTLRDDLHDVIILPKVPKVPKGQSGEKDPPVAFRFPIARNDGELGAESKAGDYGPAEKLGAERPGGRKSRSLAAPDPSFGPAFALAPTRPEPAAQNGTCIIVNQEHVRIRNVWTAARLSSEPARQADGQQAAPVSTEPDEYTQRLPDADRATSFELLVAASQGKVFHVQGDLAPRELGDLANESEIWYQLRNGFVAGSVYCRQLARVLPMVNVAALKKVEE